MISQQQPALLKEQGFRWLASFLSLWLAVAYLWLALFYPLICAPYGNTSYVAVPKFNLFEHTVTPFSAVTGVSVVQPDNVVLYLHSSESVSTTPWPVDAREDTSALVMGFIDGITLPGLSWLQPAQPTQTITLLQTQSYKQLRASPPEQPPRLSLI